MITFCLNYREQEEGSERTLIVEGNDIDIVRAASLIGSGVQVRFPISFAVTLRAHTGDLGHDTRVEVSLPNSHKLGERVNLAILTLRS